MIIHHLDRVDSTYRYIEKFVKGRKNVAVYADMQTAGQGTKGRSFISKRGGVYLSVLEFYDALPANMAFTVMERSALAVCGTLSAYGIKAGIKWPNDIVAGGKKICGIIIKNGIIADRVDYSVTGIGLNVNNEISGEIKDIAVSAKQILGRELSVSDVVLSLLANLSLKADKKEYERLSLVLNKKILITEAGKTYEAEAAGISDAGELMLSDGRRLSSAEVGLKIRTR